MRLIPLLLCLSACATPLQTTYDRPCTEDLDRTFHELQAKEPSHSPNASISHGSVESAFGSHHEEFRSCYFGSMSLQEITDGFLLTKFLVDPNGKVEKACIAESNIKNIEMRACMLTVIRRVQFPRPGGQSSVVVTYPFEFK